MVATRTARTAWNGPLASGAGQVELTSSNTGTFPVTWAKRTAEKAEGTTSPEELIAAAHSSCYSMELSGQIAAAGGTPIALQTTADVSFEPDPAGGWHISKIALTVRGEVEGLDGEGFLAAAETARKSCPVSKALTGVEITLDAALD